MWKRSSDALAIGGNGTSHRERPAAPAPAFPSPPMRQEPRSVTGAGLVIKGEITGREDAVVNGRVEGTITLPDSVLTVGPDARVTAPIVARRVIVEGAVIGDIVASELIEIRRTGTVEGDLRARRIALEDGATFRGLVDMQRAPEARPVSEPVIEEDVRPADASFVRRDPRSALSPEPVAAAV